MSPRCHIPNCLGHADERTAEVTCARCSGSRWILITPASAPDPTSYTCARCVKALRGDKDVRDPLASDAVLQAAQARASRRQIAMTSQQNSPGATQAPKPEGSPHGPR